MRSSRPYLLRAIYDWIVDSGLTPHLLVSTACAEVRLPEALLVDKQVVLNVGPQAVKDLLIDDDLVTFVARFAGVSKAVSLPMDSIQAIYARENGRGIVLPDETDEAADDPLVTGGHDDAGHKGQAERRLGRAKLKVIK